jgi:hypothetical protein
MLFWVVLLLMGVIDWFFFNGYVRWCVSMDCMRVRSSFRQAAWLTGLLELLLLVATVKTKGHSAITAIYILSGIVVAVLLLYARKKDTGEAYRLLANVGFAGFMFDTVVCLFWGRWSGSPGFTKGGDFKWYKLAKSLYFAAFWSWL